MKWYNNGWYDDDFNLGVYIDNKHYIELLNKSANGSGYIATDENGFPYIKPNEIDNQVLIDRHKMQLELTDYKVIKALETLLLSDTELHKTRQAIRDKINELEQQNNGG